MQSSVNTVILLGPTAVGKTSLGVRIADKFDWDIISADSRQVYKGLDLGSGKDIDEYTLKKVDSDGNISFHSIDYHLIDIVTLKEEYNVYKFQSDFYSTYNKIQSEARMPFIVGGTGLYIDSIARNYNFIPVPENEELRSEFEKKSLAELDEMLIKLKPDLHNKSDLTEKDRVIRALEIIYYENTSDGKKLKEEIENRPKINPLVIGTTINRDDLHRNIKIRLDERIQQGMIEEVENIHNSGYSWERLEKLGLEYRFVSMYLEGKIDSQEEMTNLLYHSICQFAKRQETWFRGMEKKGVKINWLPKVLDKEARYKSAIEIIETNLKH